MNIQSYPIFRRSKSNVKIQTNEGSCVRVLLFRTFSS